MPKKPLISIITVNLNNLEGLKKTMASIFDQTWQEFEYIVIDGVSTDGCREFIETNTNRIDYWVSEPDKGIYNAMNKGITTAKGEFLFFLNSGDWLYNENVLNDVSDKLNGFDILYGNMIKVFPDGRLLLDKGISGKEITFYTFAEGNLNHQATFINKKLFNKFGLYEVENGIVADWKFFLTSLGLNNSKVNYIDQTISFFDMTGISSNFKERDQERKMILENNVPTPVYLDFLRIKELEKVLQSSRVQKFLKTDNNKISRKLHSIIFRIFS